MVVASDITRPSGRAADEHATSDFGDESPPPNCLTTNTSCLRPTPTTMPEIPECILQAVVIKMSLLRLQDSGLEFTVLDFWCDHLGERDGLPVPGSRHEKGYVEKMACNSTITRGGRYESARGSIIPDKDVLPRSTPPTSKDFQKLVWQDVITRERGMQLDFKTATLYVRDSASSQPHGGMLTIPLFG